RAAAPRDPAPAPGPGRGSPAATVRGLRTAPGRAADRAPAHAVGNVRSFQCAAAAHALGPEHAGEHAALADLALDAQARLVQAEHVLDDGQAKAGAAALARTAGRDA